MSYAIEIRKMHDFRLAILSADSVVISNNIIIAITVTEWNLFYISKSVEKSTICTYYVNILSCCCYNRNENLSLYLRLIQERFLWKLYYLKG